MSLPIKVYDPKKQKTVTTGILHGNTYCRMVPQSNVMRLIFPGTIGMSEEVVKILQGSNCRYVSLNLFNYDKLYISKLEQWVLSELKADMGHGLQVFLPMSHMRLANVEGFNPYLVEDYYAQYPFA